MISRGAVLVSCLGLALCGCGDDGGGLDGGMIDGGADAGPPADAGGRDASADDASADDGAAGDSGGTDPLYHLSTCAFAGAMGDCDPIEIPDGPRTVFELSFALINPSTGPGCAGNLDLSLNGMTSGPGRMAWEAHELDADSCMEIGEPITGSRDLAPSLTEDVYMPNGDFTFRMLVERM